MVRRAEGIAQSLRDEVKFGRDSQGAFPKKESAKKPDLLHLGLALMATRISSASQ